MEEDSAMESVFNDLVPVLGDGNKMLNRMGFHISFSLIYRKKNERTFFGFRREKKRLLILNICLFSPCVDNSKFDGGRLWITKSS